MKSTLSQIAELGYILIFMVALGALLLMSIDWWRSEPTACAIALGFAMLGASRVIHRGEP
jgi:hypothetical protein